jgi:hypothetical protein
MRHQALPSAVCALAYTCLAVLSFQEHPLAFAAYAALVLVHALGTWPASGD